MPLGWCRRTERVVDRFSDRCQSEVIGAVLMMGIIVLVMTTAGVFLFGAVTGDGEQALADIEYDVSTDTITLSHTSGDSLDADDIAVRVTTDTVDEEFRLDQHFTAVSDSNDDGSFSPGDTWRTNSGEFSEAEGVEGDLLVIHEPSNTLLLDESFVVGGATEDGDDEDGSAEFTVTIQDTNEPVEGDTIDVTAEIENVGDAEATQTVELDAGDLGTDSTAVTLGAGETSEVTLTVGTAAGDAGDHTVTVASDANEDSAGVTVLAAADFAVTITDTNEPDAGEDIEVTFEVENVGDVEATQTLDLTTAPDIGGSSTEVTLDGGESAVETLTVGTETDDDGEYTVTVASEDRTDSTTVTVAAVGGPVLESVEATANGKNQATDVGFAYQLSEERTIALRIRSAEGGEIIGSTTVDNALSGSETVDITGGGQGGGSKENYPIWVEVEVLDTGEICGGEIGGDGNTIELCG